MDPLGETDLSDLSDSEYRVCEIQVPSSPESRSSDSDLEFAYSPSKYAPTALEIYQMLEKILYFKISLT